MAKYIRETYTPHKSRKNRRYEGVLNTYWKYDGSLLSRVPDGQRHGLKALGGLTVDLPHPSVGFADLNWLGVHVCWANYNDADLQIQFTASEDRESKLPDAEEIWRRVHFRSKAPDPAGYITKLLDTEERALAQHNLAASIAKKVGTTFDTLTAEAESAAKEACDYNRRLNLLKAEYEHHFQAALIESVNSLHTDDETPPEGSFVIRWCRYHARTIKRGPGGGFPGHPSYQPDYDDVFDWLTKSPGMGWGKLLDAFAGRDNRP